MASRIDQELQDLDQCGNGEMRIARNGTWYHQGSPIKRPELVRLFASVLKRDEQGQFWLVTPVERCRVLVEDAPFTAVEVDFSGTGKDQKVAFRTNVEDRVVLGAQNPLRIVASERGPRPYVLVRPGLEALVLRSVYYHLAERTVDGPAGSGAEGVRCAGIWSSGQFFPLKTDIRKKT